MVSEHRKFLKTRKEILEAKEIALEEARIEYVERMKVIADQYNAQIRQHSHNLSSEILHGCR